MIYFDNSATTRPHPEVSRLMHSLMDECYFNASSLYAEGSRAMGYINAAKAALSIEMGCERSEVILGPSGTVLNNLAVLGAAEGNRRRGTRVVISSVEHPSVYTLTGELERRGFEVVLSPPTEEGFYDAVDQNTVLVSAMQVNNETGLILPVYKIREIIAQKQSKALLHIDAVQAFLRLPTHVKKLGCDLLTVSAHKIHGPKGIAALYVKKGTKLSPLLFGGGQESALMPGTYNHIAAAGFSKAIEIYDSAAAKAQLKELCDYFIERLSDISFIKLNRGAGEYCDHIINISFDGYIGENVLHFLEMCGILVSVGSACSSRSKSRGRVLKAQGFDFSSAVRISFCPQNTKAEIDEFFKAALRVKDELIKAR